MATATSSSNRILRPLGKLARRDDLYISYARGRALSDGRAVSSEDFRYGIERVPNPATRSRGMEYYRGIVGAEDFVAHRSAHLSGIETPIARRSFSI